MTGMPTRRAGLSVGLDAGSVDDAAPGFGLGLDVPGEIRAARRLRLQEVLGELLLYIRGVEGLHQLPVPGNVLK